MSLSSIIASLTDIIHPHSKGGKEKQNEAVTKQVTAPQVVQVIPHYPPYVGGMELRVKELAEKVAEHGYNVSVITSDQNSYPHQTNDKNVQVTYLRSKEFLHTPFMPGLVPSLMRIPKNSIVHMHIAQAFIPEVTLVICKLRSIPCIAHVRMDVPPSSKFGKLFLETYKHLLLKPTLRRADKLIVLTEDYKTLMEQKYGIDPQKIYVIPNATDFSIMKTPRQLPHKAVNLLFVGRFTSQKNLPLLIASISEFVTENDIKIHLDIIGDGELRKRMVAQIESLGLQNVISLNGVIMGDRLQEAFERADVFILTSSYESFGTVLIEAMAKGLPIIATKIPALRNVVADGRNGILAESDPVAVAGCLSSLLSNDTLYRQISSRNLQDVRQFDWTSIVKSTLEVYDALS